MIDFNAYWLLVYNFLLSHLVVTFGLAVVIVYFCFKKPIAAVKFFGFCALLVTALYIMSLLSESGSLGEMHKKEIGTETEKGLKN